jgi:hypothetical protein
MTRRAVGPPASDDLCCTIVFDSLSAFIEAHAFPRRWVQEATTAFHDASRDRARTCPRGTRAA